MVRIEVETVDEADERELRAQLPCQSGYIGWGDEGQGVFVKLTEQVAEVVITTTIHGRIAELEVPEGVVVTVDEATGASAESFETTTYEAGQHTVA